MNWARWIVKNTFASTCPWEVWERLPDGRRNFIAAYQTCREAEQGLKDAAPMLEP